MKNKKRILLSAAFLSLMVTTLMAHTYLNKELHVINLNEKVAKNKYELVVQDSAKLNKHISTTSENKAFYHGNEFKNTYINNAGIIEIENQNLAKIANVLNESIQATITYSGSNTQKYTFNKVKFKSIEDLNRKLTKKFGVSLKPVE